MPKKKNNPPSRKASEGRGKKESSSSARQFGVVLEDINSKIDLVVEGHQGLNNKIERLDEKVEGLDKKVEGLDRKVEGLDRKVEGLDRKVEGLDRKIDKNHEEFQEFRKEVIYKFDVVFDELHLIRNDLKEKVSRAEFLIVEKRVMVLEKSKK